MAQNTGTSGMFPDVLSLLDRCRIGQGLEISLEQEKNPAKAMTHARFAVERAVHMLQNDLIYKARKMKFQVQIGHGVIKVAKLEDQSKNQERVEVKKFVVQDHPADGQFQPGPMNTRFSRELQNAHYIRCSCGDEFRSKMMEKQFTERVYDRWIAHSVSCTGSVEYQSDRNPYGDVALESRAQYQRCLKQQEAV